MVWNEKVRILILGLLGEELQRSRISGVLKVLNPLVRNTYKSGAHIIQTKSLSLYSLAPCHHRDATIREQVTPLHGSPEALNASPHPDSARHLACAGHLHYHAMRVRFRAGACGPRRTRQSKIRHAHDRLRQL